MGKKRETVHSSKTQSPSRIMNRLRKIPTAPISNSEAIEALNASNNTTNEAPAPTPTIEAVPEPVVVAETTVENPRGDNNSRAPCGVNT